MSSIKPNIKTNTYLSLTNGIKDQKNIKKLKYQSKGEKIQKLTEFNNDINQPFKTSTFNNLNIESAMLKKNNTSPTDSNVSLLRSKRDKDKEFKDKDSVNSNLMINSELFKSKGFANNLEIFSNSDYAIDNKYFTITNELPAFSSKNNTIESDENLNDKNTLNKFLSSSKSKEKKIQREYEKYEKINQTPIINSSLLSNGSFRCKSFPSSSNVNGNNSQKDLSLYNYFNKLAPSNSSSTQLSNGFANSNQIEEYTKCINHQSKVIKELKDDKTNLTSLLNEKEEKINKLLEENNFLSSQLTASKNALVKVLKREELSRKAKQKEWVNSMMLKLGKPYYNKYSAQGDTWEDGEEIQSTKIELLQIQKQKESLEVKKRDLIEKNQILIEEKQTKQISLKNILSEDQELCIKEIEMTDEKDALKYKYDTIVVKEVKLRDKLDELIKSRVFFKSEYKRLIEEEKCRFNQNYDKWPLLNNKYLLLSLLGKGGYSEVYKAYDINSHTEVAIKIHQLNTNWNEAMKESYIKHTIRENTIHENISHKNIVKHFDTIGIDKNCFCTILEHCSGPDLSTHLKIYKTLSEKEAKFIITQILSGLKYLNIDRKIIHYDLKPQNILFNEGEIKISDFGLSKILNNHDESIELTSQGVGTYWYLPPECFINGSTTINNKVDIWSLGVIFYECLYGRRPFAHSMSQERILKEGLILNAKKVEFPEVTGVSLECKEFIRKCLEYDVNKRMNIQEAYLSDYIRKKGK